MTKVLVVDDTPDIAKLMAATVTSQGYEATVASNGQQALALAAAEQPDVVLLDVMMPGMDGIEVLRRLKADPALQAIPVILVTAKRLDEDVVEGLDSGAHDYITKPFKSAVLAARLRSAIRVKTAHDTIQQLNDSLANELKHRQRMEMELAQAQKLEAIGQLAAGIAHEINTPAQYIGDNTRFLQEAFDGFAVLREAFDRLLQACKSGSATAELVTEVEAAVEAADIDYLAEEAPKAIKQSLEGLQRVTTVVRAMKEFSHPGGAGKQTIDLNRTIENTLTVSRNEWKYVADLVTDFDPHLPPVHCLPSDLGQVFLNLITNAAQAIGEVVGDGSQGKGTITVRTRADDDWVEVQIADTGPGIPEEIRTKVFDHFFTTKEVGKGTGQGLTIAHAIVVEKHGGTIHFHTQPGQGTTFVVRLPIRGNSLPEDAPETKQPQAVC